MRASIYTDPSTNDIVLTDTGQLRVNSTTQEWLSAKIEHTLKVYKGEWFLNRNIGIPYFSQIFSKEISIATVDSIFTTAILGVEGVDKLLRFNSTYNPSTRVYGVEFTVRALTGEEINGNLEV